MKKLSSLFIASVLISAGASAGAAANNREVISCTTAPNFDLRISDVGVSIKEDHSALITVNTRDAKSLSLEFKNIQTKDTAFLGANSNDQFKMEMIQINERSYGALLTVASPKLQQVGISANQPAQFEVECVLLVKD